MTDYDRDNLIAGASTLFGIFFVGVAVIGVGVMVIGPGMLSYILKTNNYQTSLKMITECRVQTKVNSDEICGKIPTWEQYK
jgi:hypothetical protein